MGQKYTVLVTVVYSPMDMYAQFQQPATARMFEQLSREIAERCLNSPPDLTAHQLTTGMALLAQFNEDRQWYRSIITGEVL